MSLRHSLKRVSPNVYNAIRRTKFMYDAASTLPIKSYGKIPQITNVHLAVNDSVEIGHEHREMLQVTAAILALPKEVPGVFVEAGSFKGASAAKLSVACAWASRKMHIFDSFEGLPANSEDHGTNIFGGPAEFPEGDYAGSLEEVTDNIRRFGRLDVCTFHKGWFDDTMPVFDLPVAGAYLDVDLQSSTRTCLRYLYPLLAPGGFIFSQDGHLPLIVSLLSDEDFWRSEVGSEPPEIEGLGKQKLVKIRKRLGGTRRSAGERAPI